MALLLSGISSINHYIILGIESIARLPIDRAAEPYSVNPKFRSLLFRALYHSFQDLVFTLVISSAMLARILQKHRGRLLFNVSIKYPEDLK